MPYGSWGNDLRTGPFTRERALLGAGFSLFAMAELVYVTYDYTCTLHSQDMHGTVIVT